MRAGLRLPHWTGPYLFGGLLSGSMSLLVSGVATFRALGLPADFLASWIAAWLASWPVAFAAVLIVGPIVRRVVGGIVAPAPAPESNRRAAGASLTSEPRNGSNA